MSRPAIFLDRDGTMNVDKGYIFRVEDWEWIPGSIEALRQFREMGFLLVVVTNQGGVAQGLYTEEDVKRLHEHVNRELAVHGLGIDGFFCCPHYPGVGAPCECRKPKPGMILEAKKRWDIDVAKSYVIGDKPMDVELARNAGAKPILVTTGHGRQHKETYGREIPVMGNLLAAMQYIKNTVKPGRQTEAGRRKPAGRDKNNEDRHRS